MLFNDININYIFLIIFLLFFIKHYLYKKTILVLIFKYINLILFKT